MTTQTDAAIEDEFEAMWNAQLLDYPTIRRGADGEFDYFCVEPARGEIKNFNAKRKEDRYLDGADDVEMQEAQGQDLAEQTLKLAGRYLEANSVAAEAVLRRACAISGTPKHTLYFVAQAFVEEVLDAAIKRHAED